MNTNWDRREFLKKTSLATVAALAAASPMAGLISCDSKKITSTADTVILLWMAGGMAHTETFDPKRFTPFEKGMESNSVLSTFKAVPTVLDGINFS